MNIIQIIISLIFIIGILTILYYSFKFGQFLEKHVILSI